MNTCAICECKSNRLNYDLGPLPADGRLPAINRVLDLLIESRFGSGSYSEPLPQPGEIRYPEPEVDMDLNRQRQYAGRFSDALYLIENALVPLPSQVRGDNAALASFSRVTSQPNLGRGSPATTRDPAMHHFLYPKKP